MFRYGIEHEVALLRADGRFADFTDVAYTEVQSVVDGLPEDAADYPDLRVGDQGIKHKRWYVEGYERFDDGGELVRCDPKGLEIRTRIHDSVEDTVAALRADQHLLDAALADGDLRTCVVAFNPVRSDYAIEPPLNPWEEKHRQGSPEERTAHLHMLTYGPDLNLSGDEIADPVDLARKLTHYSPWLVPLSFSSPFRDGRPWGGLSARTHLRTGARPAALVFLASEVGHVPSDPSLTQVARLPAEIGRIEFKAFDACPDLDLYGELLSLLTGLALDDTLRNRRTTPDAAAHRHVAEVGLADDAVHAGTGALLDAASRALAGRPADLDRVESLRERWERRWCPALDLLACWEAGEPVVGLRRSRPSCDAGRARVGPREAGSAL
ncbi:glutamate-cysteine ligase family protein [Pseudonocardia abyssalis]|uniref:glutamate-cysteine ligase family protein n=1 Tax=Pseudonocardia abyssalis TaxID=2792008 RepID=UPI001CF6FB0A|nr:glutamate-cysteine ligase family protein [Pseudonocardia abyssalis]